MKALVPWWARIGAKIVLSRVPAKYALWQRLNLFRHGAMDRADYALRIFDQHFARSGLASGTPFRALELGPGDSLLSALIAASRGCAALHLVDVGAFAAVDMHFYRKAASDLRASGLQPPDVDGTRDVAEMLKACRASYATNGVASLREIPSASVDFIWSQAVLEHVRRHEFTDFIRETRRILRPGGICSHEIDLRDHLGGALNNMRLSSRWWEADWMARSGFYTNRLRRSEMIDIFEAAGFVVEVVDEIRWESIPTPPKKFAREFRDFQIDDLRTSVLTVVLRTA